MMGLCPIEGPSKCHVTHMDLLHGPSTCIHVGPSTLWVLPHALYAFSAICVERIANAPPCCLCMACLRTVRNPVESSTLLETFLYQGSDCPDVYRALRNFVLRSALTWKSSYI
jgi:hypothetical protein